MKYYYCNYCGYTFCSTAEGNDEIRCPECGCICEPDDEQQEE